jgi:hypothetical protein
VSTLAICWKLDGNHSLHESCLFTMVVVLRRLFSHPVYVAAALVLLVGGYALRRTPILLHVFAETDCACGDLHEEVTGLTVWSPFRDHAPERIAARYFEELRDGRCNMAAAECEYDLEHRVSDWKLAYRRDRGDRVELYYKLTKYGVDDPQYALTGEGLVEATYARGAWNIVSYSSYF